MNYTRQGIYIETIPFHQSVPQYALPKCSLDQSNKTGAKTIQFCNKNLLVQKNVVHLQPLW